MGSTFSVPTCPDFVTMPLSRSGVDGTRNVLLVGCLAWEIMRRGIDEIDRRRCKVKRHFLRIVVSRGFVHEGGHGR